MRVIFVFLLLLMGTNVRAKEKTANTHLIGYYYPRTYLDTLKKFSIPWTEVQLEDGRTLHTDINGLTENHGTVQSFIRGLKSPHLKINTYEDIFAAARSDENR